MRIVFITLAILLVGQLGAELHGYSHHARGAYGWVAQSSAHVACGDCLAYAPLISAADAPASMAQIGAPAPSLITHPGRDSLTHRHPLLAFRSRAPPPRS